VKTPEEVYRELWRLWQACNDQQRPILEMAMDQAQRQIARGPLDPRWIRFVASMPPSFRNHVEPGSVN